MYRASGYYPRDGGIWVILHYFIAYLLSSFFPDEDRANQIALIFDGMIIIGAIWAVRVWVIRPLRQKQKEENDAFLMKIEAEKQNEAKR